MGKASHLPRAFAFDFDIEPQTEAAVAEYLDDTVQVIGLEIDQLDLRAQLSLVFGTQDGEGGDPINFGFIPAGASSHPCTRIVPKYGDIALAIGEIGSGDQQTHIKGRVLYIPPPPPEFAQSTRSISFPINHVIPG